MSSHGVDFDNLNPMTIAIARMPIININIHFLAHGLSAFSFAFCKCPTPFSICWKVSSML